MACRGSAKAAAGSRRSSARCLLSATNAKYHPRPLQATHAYRAARHGCSDTTGGSYRARGACGRLAANWGTPLYRAPRTHNCLKSFWCLSTASESSEAQYLIYTWKFEFKFDKCLKFGEWEKSIFDKKFSLLDNVLQFLKPYFYQGEFALTHFFLNQLTFFMWGTYTKQHQTSSLL